MSLMGKRFIVTGAGSGMGKAAALALVQHGASVAAIGRSASIVDIIGEADAKSHERLFALVGDVSDPATVSRVIPLAVERLGGLDGLIHAAGIAPNAMVDEMTVAEFDEVFAVNMRGTFLTNQAVFPFLKKRGGRILNFASPVGVTGMAGKAHYAASKGAVLAWTRSLAREWGQYEITVNAIAPAIWTPMFERTRASMGEAAVAQLDAMLKQKVPIGGSLGSIEDFLPLMLFLAGDGSRFLTGQTYVIDGGGLMMS
jgi:NAD(P)-dependent dehydrogenase (short-subunit alcohol dehydrogenase family)